MRISCVFLVITALAGCGKKTSETSPTRGNIVETVFASGTLEPRNRYNLTAQSEGYIIRLYADQGDTVEAGKVIAEIENVQNAANAKSAETLYQIAAQNASDKGPALQQARENISLLALKREQDSLNETRFRKLFESQGASKVQWENAQLTFNASRTSHVNAVLAYQTAASQARQQLAQQQAQKEVSQAAKGYNLLSAPVGGKLYKTLKEAGDYVRKGEMVAVVGDPEELYARLSVDEDNIARVKVGQDVTVNLNTEKEKNYRARIVRLLPAFDEASQSFICEAEFLDPPNLQIAGTQLQANIVSGKKNNALLIPKNYLTYGDKVNVKGKGEVQVKTGFISGDWVEISSGLDERAVIVTDLVK